jgi:hypothetical protein
VNLTEIKYEILNWILPAEDRGLWRVLVSIVTSIRDP